MCQRRRVVGVRVMGMEARWWEEAGGGGDSEVGGCAGGVRGSLGF